MVNVLEIESKAVQAIKDCSSTKVLPAALKNVPTTLERVPLQDSFLVQKPVKRRLIERVRNTVKEKQLNWQTNIENKFYELAGSSNVKEKAETFISQFKKLKKNEYNNFFRKFSEYVKDSPIELPKGEFKEFKYGQHSTSIKAKESIKETGFNPYISIGGRWDLGRGSYFYPENNLSPKKNTINVQLNGRIGYISRKDYGEISSDIGKIVENYAKENNLSYEDTNILHNEIYTYIIHNKLGFDGLYVNCESNPLTWLLGSRNRAKLAYNNPQLAIYNPKIIQIV